MDRPAPLLRGWTHLVAFPLMIVAGTALLVARATGTSARLLLAVYVVGTATMFGASALYHRVRWSPTMKARFQRIDRTAIFLAICGGYTPVAALCLDGWQRSVVLGSVWTAGAIGITLQWFPTVHRAWKASSYIVVSWSAALTFPDLLEGLGTTGFALIVAGGILYTLGAIALATRWPDPWPRVFGFHEVFHAFTIAAAALQFTAMAAVVAPRLSA